MALALFSFAVKKKKKNNVRTGEDQQEYPRPEFLDIFPKPITSLTIRILKVHVNNHFQEFILSKNLIQYLATY